MQQKNVKWQGFHLMIFNLEPLQRKNSDSKQMREHEADKSPLLHGEASEIPLITKWQKKSKPPQPQSHQGTDALEHLSYYH